MWFVVFTAASIKIIELRNVTLYSYIGTNVSDEHTGSIFMFDHDYFTASATQYIVTCMSVPIDEISIDNWIY
jgi:hypothetical protein